MQVIKVSSSVDEYSIDQFWKAVNIYFEHPCAVNKQILFSEVIFGYHVDDCVSNSVTDLKEKFLEVINDTEAVQLISNYFPSYKTLKSINCVKDFALVIAVRKIVYRTKLSVTPTLELCIFDKINKKAFFHKCRSQHDEVNENSSLMPYYKYLDLELSFSNGLNVCVDKWVSCNGITWLESVFVRKMLQWMSHTDNTQPRREDITYVNQVPLMEYYQLYDKLKHKYGPFFIENWPENTDAKKFVHEDIAIATYLILVWREPGQRFVDLGCGNGLLVHILTSEGHTGVGLDIRPRKIWDLYPSSTVLKVETVIPSSTLSYPDTDWLVGNHSDELTAWLPILANNSRCNFFVLPCCPYRLVGTPYQRTDSRTSVYRDFLRYVLSVSDICGFSTAVDRLRIPSTKRIALVGRRTDCEDLVTINKRVETLLENEFGSAERAAAGRGFKPREALEPVRNCTKLERTVIDRVLHEVMTKLLAAEDRKITEGWNCGGSLSLRDTADLLTVASRTQLKNECKGLQTLLRNHQYLFCMDGGQVRLREPQQMREFSERLLRSEQAVRWKVKTCWFQQNHPQGCPLQDKECSYRHEC